MPAFDTHRPPEDSVIDDCVHCGFCLDSCPTYVLWGQEADSPRGRIVLMSDGLQEQETLSDEMVTHFDRCLGCMACVTACPSGVRYDRLIEAARGWTEEDPERPAAGPQRSPRPHLPARSARERALRAAIFRLFPYPRRLRVAIAPLRAAPRTRLDALINRSGLPNRLPPEIASALRLAPQRPAASTRGRGPPSGRVPGLGTRRETVGMLTGCVQRVFFPQVNAATARVLAAEGCDVIVPAGQGCCGALSLHGGRGGGGRRVARQTIETFERAAVD